MPFRIVQSAQNSRLKELRRALASPGSSETGLVGIEGPILLAEAVRAGLHVRCVFVAQGSERMLETIELPAEVEVLVMPRALLDATLSTETPQPVAALVEPPDWSWAHRRSAGKGAKPLIVVLAGIQDPGNLGTILRSAEAFGADSVVCLPGTANAWNPKAVRASAGSVFRVPVLYSDEEEAFENLREVRVLTTSVQGAQPANLVDLTAAVALLIGNEGKGVPVELAAEADGAITIPCPGPVESLNAAVATSILLYETARQREAARHLATKSSSSLERRGGTR